MKYLLILLLLLFTVQPSHARYGSYNSGLNNSYYGSATKYNNTYVNPYANVNRVNVNGYYRSNGTYVQPYHRSNPDSSRFNNYSTQGNSNPYTGKKGYTSPYKTSGHR